MTGPTEAMTTEVAQPKHRPLFPRTLAERSMGFWWSIVSAVLFRWSPPPLNLWRLLLLRLFGATVHRSAFIAPSVRIDYPWNLVVDRDVVVADNVILNCMGPVEIGAGTRISRYAHLCAGTHAYERRDMRIVRRAITIGRGAWIATDAFVGPGVSIGDHCLLAARSSAFSDLPAETVCKGEPAKPYGPWTAIAS